MAAPVLSYYLFHTLAGLSPVLALSIGAAAAGLRAIYRSIRQRRINAFSAMMVLILAATLVMVLITGDARLIIARSALIPAIGGIYGIITTFLGKTLLYDVAMPLVTVKDPVLVRAWQGCWAWDRKFARRLRLLNLLWGIGFLASAVLRVVIVYSVPLSVGVLAGQLPTVVMLVTLGMLTWPLGRPLMTAMRARAAEDQAGAGAEAIESSTPLRTALIRTRANSTASTNATISGIAETITPSEIERL
jgi:hypothetical protein